MSLGEFPLSQEPFLCWFYYSLINLVSWRFSDCVILVHLLADILWYQKKLPFAISIVELDNYDSWKNLFIEYDIFPLLLISELFFFLRKKSPHINFVLKYSKPTEKCINHRYIAQESFTKLV